MRRGGCLVRKLGGPLRSAVRSSCRAGLSTLAETDEDSFLVSRRASGRLRECLQRPTPASPPPAPSHPHKCRPLPRGSAASRGLPATVPGTGWEECVCPETGGFYVCKNGGESLLPWLVGEGRRYTHFLT